MLLNQELHKILILISITWAALSSVTSSLHHQNKEFAENALIKSGKIENAINKNLLDGNVIGSWRMYSQRMNNTFYSPLHEDFESSEHTIVKSKLSNETDSRHSGRSDRLHPRNANATLKVRVTPDFMYAAWNAMEKNNSAFSAFAPEQPVWQLPVQKLNTSFTKSKKLKVLPISSMHELWHATKKFLMTDYGNYTNPSNLSDKLVPSGNTQQDVNDSQLGLQNFQKGDEEDELKIAESRGYQNGGMMKGGGQPILLIKDKGDSGGGDMNGNGGMSGKDAIGPLIMMLTPLIMMCIMMPMMMSIMGGMMNFMKGIAGMMMMLNNPLTQTYTAQGLTPTLMNKHRKTDDDISPGQIMLGPLIVEMVEKLEEALKKYDI
ncbi:uncharacterized protein TNCT_311871 [Trichonephila clavata]|uniref:Uncharacterized protein n=1 Tax=Trichonephila clavata TaxID=2740835 RepID=A0A8X6F961_TRICU|nr:uncharacterized protein TNCT_311871 [Trichonephila clavata]